MACDEPNINQPDIGGWGELLHHTYNISLLYMNFGIVDYNFIKYKIYDLMKRVVATSMTVRFTVTAASK